MNEWRTISARIAALLDAGTFFLRTPDNDNHASGELLVRNAEATALILREFLRRNGNGIPNDAKACLERFFKRCAECFEGAAEDQPFGNAGSFSGATGVLTYLASFRAEFEYLIADTEVVAKSMAMRAFIHLQSSIVADDEVRRRWLTAFDAGETTCERLGACQLLMHGIWAFKVSAEGARTDLVLSEPSWETPRRVSQGLLLTEWKLVRDERELFAKAEEAYQQAKLYSERPLAGFEVVSTRYLVLVSRGRLQPPSERIDGDVTYEFINIAVDPGSPSRDARKVAGSSKRPPA